VTTGKFACLSYCKNILYIVTTGKFACLSYCKVFYILATGKVTCLSYFKVFSMHYKTTGHLNLDFFGLKMALALLVAFSGPKKSRFQGPPHPMALVIDIARIKIITSRAIHT
jgi:hypothetical protein